MNPRPIGVFDSGVGGLTVLSAVERAVPDERLVYLGDTARVPYGTRSPDTVVRYSIEAGEFLVDQLVDLPDRHLGDDGSLGRCEELGV